jgi:hypothetical protein
LEKEQKNNKEIENNAIVSSDAVEWTTDTPFRVRGMDGRSLESHSTTWSSGKLSSMKNFPSPSLESKFDLLTLLAVRIPDFVTNLQCHVLEEQTWRGNEQQQELHDQRHWPNIFYNTYKLTKLDKIL